MVGLKRKVEEITTFETLFISKFLSSFTAVFHLWNTILIFKFTNIQIDSTLDTFYEKFLMIFLSEKIKDLEGKLKNDEDELKRKDKIILDLEAQLDAAKLTKDFQPKIHETSIYSLLNYCTDLCIHAVLKHFC